LTGVDYLPPYRSRVSLCVIVKNEAHNLRDCVAPVRDLVDDIVVVDTGSADGTAGVARGLGARVFSFAWVDSFAAARNESLRHALGDWVLWLDADDRVDEPNHGRLRLLLERLPNENVAFVMKCLCLPDPKTGRSTAVDHVRLFRRHPALRWRYRVHEQILPSLRALGGTVRWSDVVVHHTGYQDSALRQTKLERDFRLLGLEHAENPGDPFVLFNLGMILHEWGRCDEALPYLNESLRQSHPTDSIVRKLYALIRSAIGWAAGWRRRWRPAGKGSGTIRTIWSCCFTRAWCASIWATGRARRVAFCGCNSPARATTSRA
jgi:hypothetical protein